MNKDSKISRNKEENFASEFILHERRLASRNAFEVFLSIRDNWHFLPFHQNKNPNDLSLISLLNKIPCHFFGYNKHRFGYILSFFCTEFRSNKKNKIMKIILTGSLGNISKPLTEILVKKGHSVTVISSKSERGKEIETLGAKAAIGTMEDVDFLTKTFKGADIVYLMETLGAGRFFDQNLDYMAAIHKIANNYKQAVEDSGVKRIVHLSSIGAHTDKGNGMLAFHYEVENILKQLPGSVSIKFMRPVGFYYNMFAFIPTIKAQGVIIQNYGGDKKEPWVSPLDIAEVIAEEMERPFVGREVRYIASDEASPNELTKILGKAIGKPDLKWQVIPDEQMLKGMIAAGMNPNIAKGLVEMNAGRRNENLYEDYYRNKPGFSKVKLQDFAKDFATTFFES